MFRKILFPLLRFLLEEATHRCWKGCWWEKEKKERERWRVGVWEREISGERDGERILVEKELDDNFELFLSTQSTKVFPKNLNQSYFGEDQQVNNSSIGNCRAWRLCFRQQSINPSPRSRSCLRIRKTWVQCQLLLNLFRSFGQKVVEIFFEKLPI